MIKEFLNKSDFYKNVAKLTAGSALAQAIPILITPVLSRIYSPDDFAHFALVMSIVSAIAVVSTARFELAIMLPKEEDEAIHIVWLSFKILFVVTFVTVIAAIVYNIFFAGYILKGIPSSFIYFIPVMVLLLGVYQICNNWFNRQKLYNQLVISRVTNTVSTSGSNLILGASGFLSAGLLIGAGIGQFFSSAYMLVVTLRRHRQMFKTIDPEKTKELVKRYEELPKVNILQALVDMFQVNGVIYFLTAFFPLTVVGLYSFCIRLMQAPVSLVGSAFSQVFFQQASSTYHNNGNLHLLVRRTIINTAMLALPVLLVLVFFGPSLFAFAFGEKWREAGEYARLLSPWIFCDFIRSPVSQIPIIVNKQRQLFLFSVAGNIILVLAMVFGGKVFHNPKISFLILSSSLSLLFLLIIAWIYRLTKEPLSTHEPN